MAPIDLHLNRRLAAFEARLQASGKAELLRHAQAAVATAIRRRYEARGRGPPPRSTLRVAQSPGLQQWAAEWMGNDTPAEAEYRAWSQRWQTEREQLDRARRGTRQRVWEPADEPPPRKIKDALLRHSSLLKHESALLVQARTGKIGLRAFLFSRRVPDVFTPLCRCGQAPETVTHVVLWCPEEDAARAALEVRLAPRRLSTERDVAMLLSQAGTAGILLRWLLARHRLPEFWLAVEIGAEMRLEDDEVRVD